MDLSAFDSSDVAEVRVLERTIAGDSPGVVIHCVLEVVPRSGTPLRVEQTYDERDAMAVATFEQFIESLNKALGTS